MILNVSVLKHAIFAIFILTSLTMQAQNDSTKDQFLDKQQQSIAIIAALTAVGDSYSFTVGIIRFYFTVKKLIFCFESNFIAIRYLSHSE